jgi:hypothetical protein
VPGQRYALVERLTHTSVGLAGACAGVVPGAVARAGLAAALTTVGAAVLEAGPRLGLRSGVGAVGALAGRVLRRRGLLSGETAREEQAERNGAGEEPCGAHVTLFGWRLSSSLETELLEEASVAGGRGARRNDCK